MNRLLTIVLRHGKPLVSLNLALLLLTAAALHRSKPVWTAKSSLILSANNKNLNANLGKLGNVSDGETFYSQQVNPVTVLSSILTSDDTLEQVRAIDPEKPRYPRIESYKGLFKVKPEETTTIVSVIITGRNPEIAKIRGDAFVQVFQQRLNQLRQADAAQRSNFMGKELEDAKQTLRQAQQRLSEFKQSSGLINSDEQTKQLVGTINILTTAQAEAQAKAEANQGQVNSLGDRLNMSPQQAMGTLRLNERPDYQYARQKLVETETALSKATALYADGTPEIKSLQDERALIESQITQYVQEAAASQAGINPGTGVNLGQIMQQMVIAESSAHASSAQAQSLLLRINQLQQNLQNLPAIQAKLLELQRQYDISEGVYNGLIAKVQETRVNTFSNYPSVQVLDQPKVDSKPSGSKKIPILMGAILAAGFGSIALLLLLESRNPLLSPSDLQQSDMPIIGNLPLLRLQWKTIESRDPSIEFQRLASAVSLMPLDKRQLVVTSAIAAEGKTTVTVGLAMALVSLGFQVLVVDGDFRRKNQVRQRLGINLPPSAMPVPVKPGLDFLGLTLDGPELMEYIARGKFAAQLDHLQTDLGYDYILIDSAPVGTSSETTLLAAAINPVLWVIRPGISQRFPLQKAKAQLARQGAQWLGMVINGTEASIDKVAYQNEPNHEAQGNSSSIVRKMMRSQ
jgi:polysaccharide biosynthesis transport protein